MKLFCAAVTVVALVGLTVSAQPASRRAVSLIVTGGIVVTVDGSSRVLSPGAVAIDGRDIVGVDTPETIAARFSASDTIDASGRVVMPGLINTHTHAPMVLYRGLADDLALMEWLQKYIFPAEAKTVSPEMVRVGTRLAALEMIQSGTTAYADMYYFEEEIAAATKEAGIRGVLGQTIIQFPVAGREDAGRRHRPRDRVHQAVEVGRVDRAGDRAALDVYARRGDAEGRSGAVADREAAPVIIHLSETADEHKVAQDKYKTTPTQFLESIGFWGERTLAAHAVHVTAGGHRDPRPAARRRVAQSREQHEAGERSGAGDRDAAAPG